MARGESASGHDECDVSVWQCDRDPSADGCPFARLEYDSLVGHQICAAIARMRVFRHAIAGDEYVHAIGHVTRVVQKATGSESLIE